MLLRIIWVLCMCRENHTLPRHEGRLETLHINDVFFEITKNTLLSEVQPSSPQHACFTAIYWIQAAAE